MRLFIKKVRSACLSFIFPTYCLHCDQEEIDPSKLFCPSCCQLLELQEIKGRCVCCFRPSFNEYCDECRAEGSTFLKFAAAMEHWGPAKVFSAHPPQKGPVVRESMAALMIVQFYRLGWPIPDYILPLPSRNSLHDSLAEILAKHLQVPVSRALKRSFLGACQWRKRCDFSNKRLLVVAANGSYQTAKMDLWVLQESAPCQIYFLSFSDSKSII
jgi:hypothetical protein